MSTQASGRRTAGISAILAGVAWVVWAALNASTSGGLDAGTDAVGARLSTLGQLLMVATNLLLVPAALILDRALGPRRPDAIRLATVAGLASLMFWAYGAATHGITPTLEVSYLLLSAVWWWVLGGALRPDHRWIGGFTMIVGAFALWDGLLTALEPVPIALYMTASPKLPLVIVWDFVIGIALLRITFLRARPAAA